ncbi:MAG TPA: hypothetical protein PKV00_11100 [Thauera sp.]|nr:hypothetical protein [Thauera sp.]
MIRSLLAALAVVALPAAAETGVDWQFSGFATAGAVYTSSHALQFARIGIDAPGGNRVDAGPDSVLGLQLNGRFGERSAAVLQLITRETQRGDHTPRPALAFISHALTPALSVRAGRLRSPFFMLSDSADLNYSHPWVRPPVEVYGLNPFSDIDGIDLLYRTPVGPAHLELHPYAGRSRIPVIGGGRATLDNLVGLSVTMEAGEFSISAGHAIAELSVQRSSARVAALPGELRSLLSGDDARASFSSIGLQWDDGRWLVSAELARNTADAFTSSARGAYASLGRRSGAFTPYLVLARQWQDEPAVRLATADPGLGALVSAFNRSRNQSQRSLTLGVRWDFASAAALKTELTHVRTERGAHGTFIARGDPFARGLDNRAINLLSVSVDVVF